jgi:hypothetical protein
MSTQDALAVTAMVLALAPLLWGIRAFRATQKRSKGKR